MHSAPGSEESPGRPGFRIRGPIAAADLPGLCDRVCRELARHPGEQWLRCDVAGVEPDAVVVEALARLQLAARRRRCTVVLVDACPALVDLVASLGFDDVLPVATHGA